VRQVVADLAMLDVGGGGDGGQRTVCGQRLQSAESLATRAWTHPASAMTASTQSRTTSATRNHPRAGSATASTGCRSLTRTHPRLRGERWETAARWRMLMDAPLPARGARVAQLGIGRRVGLTPTCAGSATQQYVGTSDGAHVLGVHSGPHGPGLRACWCRRLSTLCKRPGQTADGSPDPSDRLRAAQPRQQRARSSGSQPCAVARSSRPT
jgi:hypothetical protein